jgi:Zn-dependent peptidase ImmA (M78 family)
MDDSKNVARKALKGAIDVRKRATLSLNIPVCIYDLAEKVQVEVKLLAVNSLEGMYSKNSHTILLSTLRPSGRRAYTCAHELGHWYYRHGNCIDETGSIENSNHLSPNERLADVFAGFLLMPPWAIKEAFSKRGYSFISCTPLQIYSIAAQFNTGYSTLVNHLHRGLQLLSGSHASDLLKIKPKAIREELLGKPYPGHLIIADSHWCAVPIDLQIGDMAIIPSDCSVEGRSAEKTAGVKNGIVIAGKLPGISRAESRLSGWTTFIRVCRKDFVGRSIYRHLEEEDNYEQS